jgi:hypothetical protein
MNILFPSNLGSPKKISHFWQKEADAAKAVGFCNLLELESCNVSGYPYFYDECRPR